MIGLLFAAITAGVLTAILFPLLRGDAAAPPARTEHELAVYRHQLAQLENEIEDGLAPPQETEALRLEIRRRLLHTAEGRIITKSHESRRLNVALAGVIALFIGLGAWRLYAVLGSPELPDRPYAARQNDPDMRLNALAGDAAAQLAVHPDAAGYKKLGAVYYALHRFGRAADAYQNSVTLDGKDAGAWSELGESLVMMNDGAVVMDAQIAFKHALALDKAQPRAQFYMGLAETQIGNLKKAVAIWRSLEQTAGPDAPWLPLVRKNIAAYAKLGGFDPASVPPESFK